jgi:hypothetical protein
MEEFSSSSGTSPNKPLQRLKFPRGEINYDNSLQSFGCLAYFCEIAKVDSHSLNAATSVDYRGNDDFYACIHANPPRKNAPAAISAAVELQMLLTVK